MKKTLTDYQNAAHSVHEFCRVSRDCGFPYSFFDVVVKFAKAHDLDEALFSNVMYGWTTWEALEADLKNAA